MVNDIQVLEHLGNSDNKTLVLNLMYDIGLTKNKNRQGNIIRPIMI